MVMIPGVGSVATFAADLLLPQSLVSLRPSEYTCPGQHRGFDKGQSIHVRRRIESVRFRANLWTIGCAELSGFPPVLDRPVYLKHRHLDANHGVKLASLPVNELSFPARYERHLSGGPHTLLWFFRRNS